MKSTTFARVTSVMMAVAFTAFAAICVSDLLEARGQAAPYFIADWQINYAAGFVRRGLLGEIARLLYIHGAIDTRTTIVVMQSIAYVVFFVASAILLAPVVARHPMLAFAVFSPMTFAFKALDPGSSGAKETVFLALLAVQAVLSRQPATNPATSNWRLSVLAVLMGATGLIHEGLLLFLPFSVAILVLTSRQPVTPLKLALFVLPALFAFGMAAVFHGDANYTAAICGSLGAGAPEGCDRAGAIAWLGRPLLMQLKATYYVIVKPPFILLTTAQTALLGGMGLALMAVDRSIAQWTQEALESRSKWLAMLACVVVPLPLFGLSDHGRFLHIWFTAATIAVAAYVACRSEADKNVSVTKPTAGQVGILPRALWAALFVAYVTSWNATGPCCPERLGTGFFGKAYLAVVGK